MIELRDIARFGCLLGGLLFLAACDQANKGADDNGSSVSDVSQSKSAETDEQMMQGLGTGPFQIRQGMIQYQVSGLQDGIETLYWRKFGLDQAVYRQITQESMGVEQELESWQIITADTVTSVDLDANTATRLPSGNADFAERLEAQQQQDLGNRLLDQLILRGSSEKILDLECETIRLQGLGGDSCLWNGIVLRSSQVGREDVIATQIDIETPVDPSHFVVPPGIPVTAMSLAPGSLGTN